MVQKQLSLNTLSLIKSQLHDGNINQTPTNNLAEEQVCGDQDARLAKKGSLKATSRDAVLKRSLKLLDEAEGSFRDVSCATIRNIKTLKTQWSERQEQLKAEGLTAKEAQRLHIETRKLNTLEQIRAEGGPFTSVEEVETYLSDDNIDNDIKGKFMRREVKYARDSCVSLPRNHI